LSRQEKDAKEGDRGAAELLATLVPSGPQLRCVLRLSAGPAASAAKAGRKKTRFAQTVFASNPLLLSASGSV